MKSMLISEVAVDSVVVKQPKRYDTYMAGKVVHGDALEKLILELPGVRIVSCKDVSDTLYMKLKLTREQERCILELEEHIVDFTTGHVEQWFKSKMNPRTVDEFFQSALVFHRKLRSVMKVRADSPAVVPDESLVGELVDLKLRVSSLKFFKSSFWLSYDLIECKPSACLRFQRDDDDDNHSVLSMADCNDFTDDVGPDGEQREALRLEYIGRLNEAVEDMQDRVAIMVRLRDELDRNNFSLATFDAVEMVLSENKFVGYKLN